MFGSVPLRTYLPDGDIDLTALYSGAAVHGWMERLRDVLVAEEHNPLAEFSVRDIQTINAEVRCSAPTPFRVPLPRTSVPTCDDSPLCRPPPGASGERRFSIRVIRLPTLRAAPSAQVKLMKCLVGDLVVDISTNQLGGLSTLCFLEEVRCIRAAHTPTHACAASRRPLSHTHDTTRSSVRASLPVVRRRKC